MDIQAILVIAFCLVWKIHYAVSALICNKCAPGTFVLTRCNETAQTICRPCEHGSFSSQWAYNKECTRCRNDHCQPTMRLVQQCNSTVDNKCGCAHKNKFHHIPTDSCRNCDPCPAGKFPVKPCSVGTICSACPKNYFSNKSNNYNEMCIKCTQCSVYKRLCTPTQDAVCKVDVFTTPEITTPKTLKQAFMVDVSTVKTVKSTTIAPKNLKKNKIDGIVIIVIIVCVIAVILIIAVMVYWSRKKVFTRLRGSIVEESKEILRNRHQFSFGGLLLREQPGEVILGLHSLLNPNMPNNWKALAAELGVSNCQIQNFRTNIDTATKEMLHFWGTSNDATLDRLYEALRNIERDDACTFLEENVEFQSESVETLV